MLTLILALLQLTCALAHQSGEADLLAKVQHTKAAILTSRTQQAKLDRLAELKHYLATDAERLSERNPAAQRRLRFTVEGLRLYLDYLDPDELAAARCARVRSQLLFSADPRGIGPESLPGEAREALEILSLICPKK